MLDDSAHQCHSGSGPPAPQHPALPIPADFPLNTIGDVEAGLSQAVSPTLSTSPSNSNTVNVVTPQVLNPRQEKAKIWHQALKKKKDLALQMLETQKVIEKVEDEVAQHLTRDTIERLRGKFYDVGGDGTADGLFLASISAISVNQ
ncbi:hypothetical protein BU15DRAFT_67869 [Melanogaster broomeanus]|nr:hypothetical protein BU15DRAFT_67869 [Melanogaster broomeanus]